MFYTFFGVCAECVKVQTLNALSDPTGSTTTTKKEKGAVEVSSNWYCLCDLLRSGFVQLC